MIHLSIRSKLLLVALVISQLFVACEFRDITLERVEGFQVESIKKGRLKGTLSVVLTNPNSFDVKVKSAQFEILSDDRHLGDAELSQSFKIKGNATKTYPIAVDAEVGNILSGGLGSIAGLLTGKQPKIVLRGELKAGNWLYSKKVPMEIVTDMPLGEMF